MGIYGLMYVVSKHTRNDRILDLILINDQESEMKEVTVNKKIFGHNLVIIKLKIVDNNKKVTNIK